MCRHGDCSSSSLRATIHLGPNCTENLEVYKKPTFEEILNLFNITQKLVLDHSEEILNVNIIESASLSWMRSTLSHDQVIQWTKAEVRVHSDSVLCLAKMSFHKEAINYKMERSSGRNFNVRFLWRITGSRRRSNWIRVEYFLQDLRHCRFFKRSRMIYKSGTLNLRNSQIGSSSCQCSTILIGQEKETMRFVFRVQRTSRRTRRNSDASVLETRRSSMESANIKPEGKWNSVVSQMVQQFK